MEKHISIISAILGLTLAGSSAHAATCASRDAIVQKLETKYSEQLTARGLQSASSLLEVFASAESGTFTVLLTNANGHSCVVSAGTDWLLEDIVKEELGTAG